MFGCVVAVGCTLPNCLYVVLVLGRNERMCGVDTVSGLGLVAHTRWINSADGSGQHFFPGITPHCVLSVLHGLIVD